MSKKSGAAKPALPEAKAEVLEKIDKLKDEAIELLQGLIRIPSPNPPGDEVEMARVTADYLRNLGFDVLQIEPFPKRVSNVARLKGKSGNTTLLFQSHLDTIALTDPGTWKHPPLGGEIHDEQIWGVGAKNMKSGLASAMFAARVIRECGIELEGDLLIAQAADEMRGGFKGLKQLVERDMLKADCAVYTETGIPTRIEVGHRGRVDIHVTVKGRTAHTTEPADNNARINAIVKMSKVIPAIAKMEFSQWEPHPLLAGEPVISVNLIDGGYAENMVPDRCHIMCDCRTLPPQTEHSVLADVERVLQKLRAEDPELQVSAEIGDVWPYSFIPIDSPIVQQVQRAVVEVTGSECPILASPATSDTRWLVLVAKIPTCKFSFTTVGSGPNERIRISDYLNMIRVYAVLTLNMLYGPYSN
jgi:succinyl-diaminopimelate desuccinylase